MGRSLGGARGFTSLNFGSIFSSTLLLSGTGKGGSFKAFLGASVGGSFGGSGGVISIAGFVVTLSLGGVGKGRFSSFGGAVGANGLRLSGGSFANLGAGTGAGGVTARAVGSSGGSFESEGEEGVTVFIAGVKGGNFGISDIAGVTASGVGVSGGNFVSFAVEGVTAFTAGFNGGGFGVGRVFCMVAVCGRIGAGVLIGLRMACDGAVCNATCFSANTIPLGPVCHCSLGCGAVSVAWLAIDFLVCGIGFAGAVTIR